MLNLEEIQTVIHSVELAPEKRAEILKLAEQVEKDKKAEKSSENRAKSKYKHSILIRGDKDLKEKVYEGWVVKVKDDVEEITIPSRLSWAVGAQNGAAKKNKNIIELWSDAFIELKRKFTKQGDCDVNILTKKEPARVIVLESSRIDGKVEDETIS